MPHVLVSPARPAEYVTDEQLAAMRASLVVATRELQRRGVARLSA